MKTATKTTYQRQIANGTWVAEDNVERFIPRILERESWYAARVKREPMTTSEEVLAFLASGNAISYDSDWYAMVRMTPAPAPAVEPIEGLVRCSCGHRCDRSLVMNASLGTSCPACYDRMSS